MVAVSTVAVLWTGSVPAYSRPYLILMVTHRYGLLVKEMTVVGKKNGSWCWWAYLLSAAAGWYVKVVHDLRQSTSMSCPRLFWW